MADIKSEEAIQIILKHVLSTEGPNISSSLIHGLDIINELIRRADLAKSFPDLSAISIDHVTACVSKCLDRFHQFLVHPKTKLEEINMTVGKIKPLGIERLKICEAFTEFIRIGNTEINEKLVKLKFPTQLIVRKALLINRIYSLIIHGIIFFIPL